MHARQSSRLAVAARNPFASFAPPAGGRDTNAETKLYEVPRELIEIARAHASGAETAGTTTPLAPRPDAGMVETLRAYTERLSSKPPRVPSALLDDVIAAGLAVDADHLEQPAVGEPDAAASAEAQGVSEPAVAREPEPLLLERPISRRPSLRRGAPPPREASRSRAWMMYAALSLLGLASCAHVLLAS